MVLADVVCISLFAFASHFVFSCDFAFAVAFVFGCEWVGAGDTWLASNSRYVTFSENAIENAT